MTAPELSPREREIVARFEAAPYPPKVAWESLIAELRAVIEPPVLRFAGWLARHLPGGDR